jgi:hypothetical protein
MSSPRCYYLGYVDKAGNANVCYSDTGSGGLLQPLSPRRDLRNHSPTGFQWGYGGSGPAQLALAILADHLGDDERALALYQEFKRSVIAKLPEGKKWELTPVEIDAALHELALSEVQP